MHFRHSVFVFEIPDLQAKYKQAEYLQCTKKSGYHLSMPSFALNFLGGGESLCFHCFDLSFVSESSCINFFQKQNS